jgi:hypothetical protein
VIAITKGQKPQVLIDHEEHWREEYAAAIRGDANVPKSALTRYRHPEIKSAVRDEASEKCVYCESSITHVHPGDCEHILPKSRRPDLVVAWDNLAFVCSVCNTTKRDYYDESQPLLNPFLDEPRNHLHFAGAFCMPIPGSDLGRRTRTILELDRAPLIEHRGNRMREVGRMLDEWQRLPVGTERDLTRAIIVQDVKEGEYVAMCSRVVHDLVAWPEFEQA